MKLSVIVPVAPNRGDRLRAMLSRLSLSAQQYTKRAGEGLDFEVIIADGGATDDTRELCEFFMDHMKLKYIYLPIKEFVNAAYPRNVMLRAAEGTIIGHLDIDHWIGEDVLYGMMLPFSKGLTKVINRGYVIDSSKSQFFKQGGSYQWAEKFNTFMLNNKNLGVTIDSVYREAKIPPPGRNNTLWVWAVHRRYLMPINCYDEIYVRSYCREDDDIRERFLAQQLPFYDLAHKEFCGIHLWHPAPWRTLPNEENKRYYKKVCEPVKKIVRNEGHDWGKMIEGSFSIINKEVREPKAHEEWIKENITDVRSYEDNPQWKNVQEIKDVLGLK